jgi:hypothetical protein
VTVTLGAEGAGLVGSSVTASSGVSGEADGDGLAVCDGAADGVPGEGAALTRTVGEAGWALVVGEGAAAVSTRMAPALGEQAIVANSEASVPSRSRRSMAGFLDRAGFHWYTLNGT